MGVRFDDERGDYILRKHDHLSFRYELLGVLGRGSFGQVVRCLDHRERRQVAVKIIRNRDRFQTQAKIEISILSALTEKVNETIIDIQVFLARCCWSELPFSLSPTMYDC